MNWIISKTSKFNFHTDLKQVLAPLREDIHQFSWLVSDLELNTDQLEKLPVNHQQAYFLLSSEKMELMLEINPQVIWGVFSAMDSKISPTIHPDQLPYVNGNPHIWENGKLQTEASQIEILAFDSTYTIVKFADKALSAKFKSYFEEAIALEKF